MNMDTNMNTDKNIANIWDMYIYIPHKNETDYYQTI